MLRETPCGVAANAQTGLALALMNPSIEPPAILISGLTARHQQRFNVYRNNVIVSLTEALAAAFPAVLRLTGHDFFRAMARAHIRETPPTSPLLFEYGNEFPGFIDHYPYASSFPWLGDVARIERAWLDVCHAADAPPLQPELLAAIQPADLIDLRFVSHPAVCIVRSRFSAGSIFTMNRTAAPITKLAADVAEEVVITRPGMEVEMRFLPPGGAVFLAVLLNGGSLGAATVAAFEEHSTFDLAANLSGLLEAGAFTDIRPRAPRQ